jgi:hypothetical protein
MSKSVYIRIDRPEEYDDVAAELLIEDWIGCLKSGAMSTETGGFDWRQVAAPVDITDEMVEAACSTFLRASGETPRGPIRDAIAAALRAALGVAKP